MTIKILYSFNNSKSCKQLSNLLLIHNSFPLPPFFKSLTTSGWYKQPTQEPRTQNLCGPNFLVEFMYYMMFIQCIYILYLYWMPLPVTAASLARPIHLFSVVVCLTQCLYKLEIISISEKGSAVDQAADCITCIYRSLVLQ